MNVLFLLGAGASCDADINVKNPPLGNQLFDELEGVRGDGTF